MPQNNLVNEMVNEIKNESLNNSKQSAHPNNKDDDHNSLDLVKVVQILLNRKWLIILGTLGIFLASILLTFALPKVYRSESFLELSSLGSDLNWDEIKADRNNQNETGSNSNDANNPKNSMLLNETLIMNELLLINQVLEGGSLMTKSMSIPDYKRYLPMFTNHGKFLAFINYLQKNNANYSSNPSLNLHTPPNIEPVYAYTKKDLNDLGQISKEVPNFVVGLKISGLQPTAKQAETSTTLYALYIKDCILHGKLNDFISDELKHSLTRSKSLQYSIIRDELKLKQIKNTELEQLLSLNRLSQLSEELKYTYLSSIIPFLAKETSGEALFNQCHSTLDTFFTNKNATENSVLIAKNELKKDIESLKHTCDSIRTIPGMSQTAKLISPRRIMISGVGLITGFFLFLCLAFLSEWWKKNKEQLKSR